MRPLAELTAPLSRFFTARLGADAAAVVSEPTRIATGNSRAMLAVGVDFERGGVASHRDYVLRVEQGGVFGTDSADEVRLMRALRRSEIPVAPVRFYERDAAVIGAPFFVMDRIAGRGESPGMESIRECVRLLKRQHELDWRRLGLGFLGVPSVPRRTALQPIDHWERVYRDSCFLPVPLLDEAAAWLRRHAPAAERVALLHGDPGPGNYMFEGDRITAVTDWEFAHLGDPQEDWVYMATIRGQTVMTPDDWRALFAEEAGVIVPADRWRYWDAFNQFKAACANLTALKLFVTGANPAPNMVAIGTSLHHLFVRRLAEIVGGG
jgi:aminoglycoside phosphotransferase (APT) family kinase protein